MADELNLDDLVKAFEGKGYSLLERIILSTDGTVQTLLSVIWGDPVRVRVLDQLEREGVIIRLVDLEARDLVVARARSRVPADRNSAQVLDRVRGRSLGLGQIAAALGQNPRRTGRDHGADDGTFWRKYEMELAGPVGPELYFEIQEMFPRALYRGLVEAWRGPRWEAEK
jgi:chorismate-pyruvate lyase